MAEAPSIELADDEDEDEELEEQEKTPRFKLNLQIRPLIKPVGFGLLALVVVIGGTVGTLYALGLLQPQAQAAASAEPAPAASDAPAADAADAPQEAPPSEAIYIDLDPPFTVNFSDGDNLHFLQVSLVAMARDPGVETLLKKQMPAVRNDLMMLFSSRTRAELATREGKVALQGEVVKTINSILQAETDTPGVEAAYFTAFVMQ